MWTGREGVVEVVVLLSTLGVYKVQWKASPKEELFHSPRDHFVKRIDHTQASVVVMMSTV